MIKKVKVEIEFEFDDAAIQIHDDAGLLQTFEETMYDMLVTSGRLHTIDRALNIIKNHKHPDDLHLSMLNVFEAREQMYVNMVVKNITIT